MLEFYWNHILMGPTYGCYRAFKYMRKSNGGNGGVVINTSSLAGFLPTAENPVYAVSKHGIIGLTRRFGVCVADIEDLKAEEFVREQEKSFGKGNVIAIHCDVSKESDYSKLFEETLKYFKRVDVLINNAGVLLEHDPRKSLEVNLLGPLFGCHAALKYMGKSKGGNGGVVINTASLAGFLPVAIMPAYVASKHGLVGLTRSFGLPFHYDKDEIIFAALCPYFVDTDSLKAANQSLDPTLDFSKRTDLMSPEFAAKGVLKILQDKINGSTLLVISNEYRYEELEEKFKILMP